MAPGVIFPGLSQMLAPEVISPLGGCRHQLSTRAERCDGPRIIRDWDIRPTCLRHLVDSRSYHRRIRISLHPPSASMPHGMFSRSIDERAIPRYLYTCSDACPDRLSTLIPMGGPAS